MTNPARPSPVRFFKLLFKQYRKQGLRYAWELHEDADA